MSAVEAGVLPDAPPANAAAPPSRLARAINWVSRNSIVAIIIALLALFILTFFSTRMIITVPAGHQGVIWRRLWGTDLDTVFPEGTQLIFPWNRMTVYDLRIQRHDLEVRVLSTDGLEIPVSVNIRYHPERKTLPRLHQQIGPDYRDRIVVPEVTAAVRQIMGGYRPQQLYTVRTDEMQSRIIELAAKQARERFVEIDDVLIAQIRLPDIVQAAIQQKLRQEQEAEEYRYRIAKEEQERLRKELEAQGIANYQRIINEQPIADATLRWRGIDATLQLARSNNAKVIVIGGQSGLPLILDASTPTITSTPAPATAGAAASTIPVPPPAAPRTR